MYSGLCPDRGDVEFKMEGEKAGEIPTIAISLDFLSNRLDCDRLVTSPSRFNRLFY